jgi:hypothetical protein
MAPLMLNYDYSPIMMFSDYIAVTEINAAALTAGTIALKHTSTAQIICLSVNDFILPLPRDKGRPLKPLPN